MRGAGRATGWDFSRRSRLAFIALAAYLVAFVVVKWAYLGPEARVRFDPPNGLAAFIMVPASLTFFFFVGLFTYGLSGDLAARESIFPRRMFTLPVRTTALAGWPMLYGISASAVVWTITVAFARWAGGGDVGLPWVWPGFMMAAWLAWMQAMMWLPYGLRNLRVIVAVSWLVMVDAIVLFAVYSGASEGAMVAILAPQLPLAYLVACYAVGRARQGYVPEWRLPFATTASGERPRPQRRFASPARAQIWFEWRRHGWTLPWLTGTVVACELLLLFIPGNQTPGIVFAILFFVVITPPLMAVFAAPALSTPTAHAATRPMTSLSLVAAKLEMALWSTVAAWTVLIVLTALALLLSGAMPVAAQRFGAFIDATEALRGTLLILLLFAALVGSTWKNLAMSLAIGLAGREWLTKSVVLGVFVLLIAAGPLAYAFARSRAAQSFVWEYLPWLLAGLVCVKISVACWLAIGLHERRVLGDRALLIAAACWLAAVVALYALLEWMAAGPLFPFYFLAAIAVLAVPLARLSAAPLAFAWNRHR